MTDFSTRHDTPNEVGALASAVKSYDVEYMCWLYRFYYVYNDSIYLSFNFRDIFDKMRQDLRLWKEETQRIETSRTPKVTTINKRIKKSVHT